MKRLLVFMVIAVSALLCFSGGVFAETNDGKLMVAFNDSENKTVEMDILNSKDSAWDKNGNPVGSETADAVVIYDKESNTLTLSGYQYKGIGCFWVMEVAESQGLAGIYAENMGTLNIIVEKNSKIELDGSLDKKKTGHSNGILGTGDTNLNITGLANAKLEVQHGIAGNFSQGSAIQSNKDLSISGEGEGTPFELICRAYHDQPYGWDFYGLLSREANINLKNIKMDIESCSDVTGGMSIGIAAGGIMDSDIYIENCSGIIKGGDNVEGSEGIHSGTLGFAGSSTNNNLTIKNSQLKVIARDTYKESQTAKSSAIMVMREFIVDGSILELETSDVSEESFGLIQSESEEARLIVKNQSEITAYGKDGAIVYWDPKEETGKRNDIDFSEYGKGLKVMAGANAEEAVLLDNPQDCVGYDISYTHIFAQEDPEPVDPVNPSNPTTGIHSLSNTGMIYCGLLLCIAIGCVVFLAKKRVD